MPRTEYQRTWNKEQTLRNRKDEKATRCFCPRCEIEGRGPWHMVRMNWTGRGYPRMYCPGCRGQVNNMGMLPLGNY